MHLVNRAQTQHTSILAHAEGIQQNREEYGLQMSLADYTLDQTESQQAHLADIVCAVMKKAREEYITAGTFSRDFMCGDEESEGRSYRVDGE
jgi:hypothetical protein